MIRGAVSGDPVSNVYAAQAEDPSTCIAEAHLGETLQSPTQVHHGPISDQQLLRSPKPSADSPYADPMLNKPSDVHSDCDWSIRHHVCML